MAKWITASSRFISKIFCRTHMLTLTFHDNKWCPIKAVGFSEDAGTLCFEQVHLKIFIHIIIIFFFLQHLSSVIGAILRRKLCRFHLRRDSHRWLCWISSRPIAESPIHASSFVGGCEHYINIPGAFFERKAYNSGEDRYCAAGAWKQSLILLNLNSAKAQVFSLELTRYIRPDAWDIFPLMALKVVHSNNMHMST